jgi:hypothetical protein
VRLVRAARARRGLNGVRAAVLGAILALGCGARPAPPVGLGAWTLSPQPASMGPSTLTMMLPAPGAQLQVEGHMSHPGMAPVVARAEDLGQGRYRAEFTFTMAGDWSLMVSGRLADGRAVEHRIDVAGVRPRG